MTGSRFAARAVLLALVAALAAGCMAFKDPMQYEDTFTESMKTFTQYVRWGNFSGATEYLVESQRDEFLKLAPQLTDVRFTDYEVLRKDLNDDRNEATVDVVLTGYRLSSPISRTVHLHQKWKRTGRSDWKVTLEMEPMRLALGLAAK